jgi:hypothetical protein
MTHQKHTLTAHENDRQPEYEIEVIVRGSAVEEKPNHCIRGDRPMLAMLRIPVASALAWEIFSEAGSLATTGSRACVFPARGGVV